MQHLSILSHMHDHDEQCPILVHARSRILAAEARLHAQTANAHAEFKRELENVIAYLEAELAARDRGTTPPSRLPLVDMTNITQRPRRVRRRTVLNRYGPLPPPDQENRRPVRVPVQTQPSQTTGL